MIRDITLGQYYQTDSVLHRLDCRVKLVGTLAFIISLFVVNNVWGYLLAALFLALCIRLSNVPFKFMVKGMKSIVFLMLFAVVFNLFLTPGTPAVTIWKLKITWEGIEMASKMAVRLVMLIIGSSLMTLTTTPNHLTDGLESLLNPLKKLKVPVHEVSMMMSIALRFIQQLREGIPGLPISGIGGIETWEDALEFILLGASTLQVTTAVMQYGYRIVEDMKNGLMHYLEDHGVEHLSDLVGLANKNIVPAEELDRDYIVHPALKAEACIGCGRCYISCFDGAHQAIRWNETERRPDFDTEKCVGCLLCSLVCPTGAITKGEVVMKPNRIGRPEAKEI